MKRIFAVALTAIALSACNSVNAASGDPGAMPEPAKQSWICGREYENFAWGYQRHGVVIDGDGHVLKYDFKGTPAGLPNPWHAKDMNNMSEAELRQRYNGAVDTGKRVSADEIAQHVALMRDAAQTPPTEGRNAGADMGETTVYCLVRDVPSGTYRQVLLDQKGDFERTNPSSAAKALATWLAGIFSGT